MPQKENTYEFVNVILTVALTTELNTFSQIKVSQISCTRSPVSVWGHGALDDDDLPGVQASGYGPRVWDRLRGGGVGVRGTRATRSIGPPACIYRQT